MFTAKTELDIIWRAQKALLAQKYLPFEPVSKSYLKLFKNSEIFMQYIWNGANTSAFVGEKKNNSPVDSCEEPELKSSSYIIVR